MTDTNQASEVLPDQGGEQLEERLDDISTMGRTQMKREVMNLIRTEIAKVLDRLHHEYYEVDEETLDTLIEAERNKLKED